MKEQGKFLTASLILCMAILPAGARCDVLRTGQALSVGQRIVSDGGRYFAILQGDGNFVVYRNDGVPFWSTGTVGSDAATAVMQGDGNFVIYSRAGHAVWSTGTWGRDRMFGVDGIGRAMVLDTSMMKKVKRATNATAEGLLSHGARREWLAPNYDVPPLRPRPKGKPCIGDPIACANSRPENRNKTHEWFSVKHPIP